ncbi:mediator of RNA polymerase II transcription subunit 13 [Marchantia polymorpha subsp. ruderalis]|uniref:Mediator of RNA polymerase II transcription subunit 13 n=2 Tax=Marchantia polymorpha TaxID=3197 RepID=A0AAF6AKJ2_MARPO|nr:hypothetical protein MARPO_0029s0052 [Marchantia polymorpha]BBM96962.1 hypothetical protein Mp_1g01940 [Marchantia polymorpha subsp. ruderalis]|eukprot:PTQ42519.1 hypothetical protein MARPO_0029s0052 [Marchantia polymorpha]
MITNIFRIAGLHQVSWFQLIPDVERSSPSTSRMEKNRQDAMNMLVMMAHVRLQGEGHLSAWTVSPIKEGSITRPTNSDERLKLWIFSPGRHDNISPSVHPMIMGLKVVGAGLWCVPGDNEEVGAALSEALRNRLERSLRSLSYVRFGDVFVKCRRHGVLESRKVLPTCELMFMGSEEALFVHVVVRRKRVRLLSAHDMQLALAQQLVSDSPTENSLTVAVPPYGLSGRLTGCCPGDLVSVLYRSKLQAFTASSLPFRVVSSSSPSSNGGVAVQSCYAEVWVGQAQSTVEQAGFVGSSPGNTGSSQGNVDPSLDQAREADDEGQVKAGEDAKVDGKVLIYPMEAVLAPVLPPVPSRTYLRRCWLQEWAGTHWLEDSAVPGLNWNRTVVAPVKDKPQISGGGADSSSTSSSSSGSGGASIKSSSSRGSSGSSSGSSSSSESEVGTGEGELEGDADSLGSKGANTVGGGSFKRSSVSSVRNSAQNPDVAAGNSGSKRSRGKVSGLSGEPSAKVGKISTSPGGELSAMLDGGSSAAGRKGGGNTGELTLQGSMSIAVGTPREGGSQVGTPWEWTDEGMGLGMGMGMEMQTDADILAEFGDFGDFFEDDVLGFGEPPGTAESQSMIFSLADSVEGVNTPGTICMDNSDPMLLPILDFPTLEGFGGQSLLSMKEQTARGTKVSTSETTQPQSTGQMSPPTATPVVIDVLAKAEALLLFPPGYAPVELPVIKDEVSLSSTYMPETRKVIGDVTFRDVYVYSATPPPLPAVEVSKVKAEQITDPSHNEMGDGKTLHEAVTVSTGKQALNVTDPSGDSTVTNNLKFARHQILNDSGPGHSGTVMQDSPVQDSSGAGNPFLNKIDIRISAPPKSTTPVLATELECGLLQVSMLCATDFSTASINGNRAAGTPSSLSVKLPSGVKDGNSDYSQSQGEQVGRVMSKPPPAQKKKLLPSRIAGDADEDVQDGLRAAPIGVWRPVQTPKPQKTGNSTVDSRIGSSSASPDTGNMGADGNTVAIQKLNNWQSVVDAIPLLAQQAAVASDIALDGECGDGPLGWLAFQERQRHQCGCGPGINHIGCGGMFSIRHSLDNAGLEYIDPLAAEVSPATVANLLQSDFRVAISSAFGESNIDGPLTGLDWCRGRVQGDCGSATADSKEGMSAITMAAGEPVTPPHCNAGNPGVLKVPSGQDDLDLRRGSNSRILDTSSLSDQARGDDQRRTLDDAGTSDSELQPSASSHGATMIALPTPALLVGYQEDWLKTSPNVLHLWEKAPLEPYAPPKPVSYYVLCLGLDSLLTAASDFFQQLSSVYETCKLGTHAPAVTPGLTGSTSAGFSKSVLPGFMIVDSPCPSTQSAPTSTLIGDFVASMDSGWNFNEFRKSLSKVCKNVPILANPSSSQRDPDQGQSVVVYVVSPSSEPAELLQIVLDASQCFGSALSLSEKERRSSTYSQAVGTATDECSSSPVVGFSTSRFVLQVLPAEVVMKASTTLTSELSTLRDVAFGVYNKARRIQRKIALPESLHPSLPSSRVRSGILQSGTTLPGMWKDCNTVRNSAVNMGIESSLRSSWDGGWQSATSRFGDSSVTDGGSLVGDASSNEAGRFLYEPLFILAEPGIPDTNANYLSLRSGGKDSLRSSADEATGSTSGLTPGLSEPGAGAEGADGDSQGSGSQPAADLHCCYLWTDDWQWLISVWTDSRGELLDIHVLPLVGAVKDAGLQILFTQVLHQGLQLLTMAAEAGSQRPRNIMISRLGDFTERECQDWYRTVMLMGGDDSRRWPVQLWPGALNGNSSLQNQDIAYLSDRTLGLASSSSRPPSPNPSSSYTSRNKSSGMGMNLPRRQGQGLGLGSSQSGLDSKGLFQWVSSISLVSVRVEHALQTICVSDLTPSSGPGQGGSASATWPAGSVGNSSSSGITGVSTVKTLANTGASYLLVPTNTPRFLTPIIWQSPVVPPNLPPIAQLLQGSPIVSALASAYVISPPTPSPMSEFVQQAIKEEWPSTLHVGLIAFSGNPLSLESSSVSSFPHTKSLKDINKDSSNMEAHRTVSSVAAQVHALSWLTVSPSLNLRHSPLPFHCHVAQRLRRLLSYLDVEQGFPRHPHTPV